MNRILLEKCEIQPDGTAVLTDSRAEHIRSVLHGTPGQVLKTGMVDGDVGTAIIQAVMPTAVTLACQHDQRALPPWFDLILAPPRPRVMKRLLPQLATLGVRRIFLVGAEKVEKDFWGAQILKEALYRPLLIEGLMQGAVSTAVPQIEIRKNLTHWLTRGNFAETFAAQPKRILAHPGTAVCSALGKDSSIPLFAIGPEGGWTPQEVDLFQSLQFGCYDLGARILRTETALVALVSRFLPN